MCRIQAYAYCGCYFALPEQLYNCANVELELHGNSNFAPSTAQTASIVSSAILNGPIAPPSATLTDIPFSGSGGATVYSPRQSGTLVPTSVASMATIVTTSCNSELSDCSSVTYMSTSAVMSSYSTLAAPAEAPTGSDAVSVSSAASDIPSNTGSAPTISTPTGTAIVDASVTSASSGNTASSAISAITSGFLSSAGSAIGGSLGLSGVPTSVVGTAAITSFSSTAATAFPGGVQSTNTLITTQPITGTTTITGADGSVTTSTYTSTTVSTILSCEGGCTAGPSRLGECVIRRTTRILEHGEM
ncbi:MAG: hypothetical protein Q9174_004129 [Haloplaca sp. 1 TL-2023]